MDPQRRPKRGRCWSLSALQAEDGALTRAPSPPPQQLLRGHCSPPATSRAQASQVVGGDALGFSTKTTTDPISRL